MAERIISVGLKEPKSLVKDIIYVTLEGSPNIFAHAVSKEDFKYSVRATTENVLSETTKDITNREGMEGHPRAYWKFLEEIAEKNACIIDYSRAIKEGTRTYDTLRELLR